MAQRSLCADAHRWQPFAHKCVVCGRHVRAPGVGRKVGGRDRICICKAYVPLAQVCWKTSGASDTQRLVERRRGSSFPKHRTVSSCAAADKPPRSPHYRPMSLECCGCYATVRSNLTNCQHLVSGFYQKIPCRLWVCRPRLRGKAWQRTARTCCGTVITNEPTVARIPMKTNC